jgi:hypothetical protein
VVLRLSDPAEPVRDIYTEHADALQLRVRHLKDDRVWAALSKPDPTAPNHWHTKGIEAYQRRYQNKAVASSAPAWFMAEGPVLVDGCHRACAIYLLDPEILDASLHPHPIPDGVLNLLPGLRGPDP